ncbi:MAG: hypothetical protein RLZZ01_144 [Actinomycetota bacterium]
MTTENDEFRTSLVSAVQAELDRHASAVVRELEAVRRDAERDRSEFLAALDEAVARLPGSEPAGDDASDDDSSRRSRGFRRPRRSPRDSGERRLDDLERRLLERIEDVRTEVSAKVEASSAETARHVTEHVTDTMFGPFAAEVRRELAELTDRLAVLDARLADFDTQAARMLTYVSETTARLDRRQDELAARLDGVVDDRLAGLDESIADLGGRLVTTEEALRSDVVERLGVLEASTAATIASTAERVANIDDRLVSVDERVGTVDERLGSVDDRLSALDDQLVVVDERLTRGDERLADVDARFGASDDRLLDAERRVRSVADSVAAIDLEAIDAMKDKLSSAAGEAMLVRIEMERFQKTIGERSDQLAVRLTEVETTLQDTTLDVAASVQLDRLEEIERALAELDPDQFVRRDGNLTDPTATAPPLDDVTGATEVGDPESLTLASAESILKSDAPRLPERPEGSDTSRSDIDAIIAAAEAANEREG